METDIKLMVVGGGEKMGEEGEYSLKHRDSCTVTDGYLT